MGRVSARVETVASLVYGAMVTLAAFGLVVVAATVGNALGGAAGRETALVFVAVASVGLALLLGSYELRRGAEGARLARSGREGAPGRVRRRARRGLLTP